MLKIARLLINLKNQIEFLLIFNALLYFWHTIQSNHQTQASQRLPRINQKHRVQRMLKSRLGLRLAGERFSSSRAANSW